MIHCQKIMKLYLVLKSSVVPPDAHGIGLAPGMFLTIQGRQLISKKGKYIVGVSAGPVG